MHRSAIILGMCMGLPVQADTVIATRNIRPQTILQAQDLSVLPDQITGPFAHPTSVIGQETRTILYAGRPIQSGDIGPPTLIDRNQRVTLIYKVGGLTITTDARALGRGGVGDVIQLSNMSSRTTVSGLIQPDGSVLVQ